ncbi:MAG: hypothetical protein NUW37_02720, partial [Planctomycetes bacterium]|nr:hypothetical protein [Planctomycetota bacterium]
MQFNNTDVNLHDIFTSAMLKCTSVRQSIAAFGIDASSMYSVTRAGGAASRFSAFRLFCPSRSRRERIEGALGGPEVIASPEKLDGNLMASG